MAETLSSSQLTQLASMVSGLMSGSTAPTTAPTMAPTTITWAPFTPMPAMPAASSAPTTDKPSKKKKKKTTVRVSDTPAAPVAVADGKKTTAPSAGGGGGTWNKATSTYYNSYPECCTNKSANQDECKNYSGCKYAGTFAAVGKKSKEWVMENNIVAFYTAPNDVNRRDWPKKYKNKKLIIRDPKTQNTMDVTVVDTCDDGDCGGCCSKNANKNGGTLIDLEYNTAKRFYKGKIPGVATIEWQFA